MEIFHDIKKVTLNNLVVTIGIFDGVHIGHQRILHKVVERANMINGKSLVITLWPHPKMVLSPNSGPVSFLSTPEEKYELIEKAGIDAILVISFTHEFARISSSRFIHEIMMNELSAKEVIIGYNHHFGKNREGNYMKLKEASKKYNFTALQVDPVNVEKYRVSSSAIRKQIIEGNIKIANRMLGYPYYISGKIIKGTQLGKELTYPTANIDISASMKLLPGNGVYAVTIKYQNQIYKGMANVGIRPTVNNSCKRNLEVHIFNFSKNIYKEEITIQFLEKIRDEKKFENIQLLKKQLDLDKKQVLNLLR